MKNATHLLKRDGHLQDRDDAECCCDLCQCGELPELFTITYSVADNCCAGPFIANPDTQTMLTTSGPDPDCCYWMFSVGEGNLMDCEGGGGSDAGAGLAFLVRLCNSTGQMSIGPYGLGYCQPDDWYDMDIIECGPESFISEISGIGMTGCCNSTADVTISAT